MTPSAPAAPTTFDSLADLLAAPPLDLGASEWTKVSAAEIAYFEEAVHGAVSPYLALSLTNRFLPQLMQVPAASSGVNYGAESVRFGPPVGAGDLVRIRATLRSATEVPGGVQTTIEIVVDMQGGEEPACVVRSLSRWLA